MRFLSADRDRLVEVARITRIIAYVTKEIGEQLLAGVSLR